MYYIVRETSDSYKEKRYSVYYVDLTYNTRTEIIKGRKGGRELSKLCGTYEKAMFCSEDVWYYVNLSRNQIVSLDEQSCDWNSHVKKEYGEALNILYLNLEKNVMWVLEENTLIPLEIGTDRNAVVPGIQRMNLDRKHGYDLEDSYFDGETFFVADSYYKLYSKYSDNEWIDWTQGNKHGQCEKMIILGNFLYIDIDAMGCSSGYIDGKFEACTYKIGRCVREKMRFQRWYY